MQERHEKTMIRLAIGLLSIWTTLGFASESPAEKKIPIKLAPRASSAEKRPMHPAAKRPFHAKPVRIVTIAPKKPTVDKMVALVEKQAARGTDLIVLPETWPGLGNLVTLNDAPITALAALAKKYRTYIISPIDRKDGTCVYNSAVLLDRAGRVAGIYNKVQPVGPSPKGKGGEFKPGVDGRPGNDAPVFKTDFGRIGMAICFDAQFPEVWQRLADNGADLVLFSSMYSAGKSLGAYAMLHHFHIVSCCNSGECQVYDFTGEKLLDEKRGLSRITLDLGRRLFHNNDPHNYGGKRQKLLRDNPGVVIDKWMAREDWHVLRASQPGIDLPALIKKYDLRELRDYINAERRYWDAKRGFQFKRLGPAENMPPAKQGQR